MHITFSCVYNTLQVNYYHLIRHRSLELSVVVTQWCLHWWNLQQYVALRVIEWCPYIYSTPNWILPNEHCFCILVSPHWCNYCCLAHDEEIECIMPTFLTPYTLTRHIDHMSQFESNSQTCHFSINQTTSAITLRLTRYIQVDIIATIQLQYCQWRNSELCD